MADEPTPTPAPTPAPEAAPTLGEPVRLPDDHPLVTAFTTQKAELAEFRKAKAEAEEAAKTDAQKKDDAIAALQTENESLKATALRNEVAAAKGVPADLISGSTKEELEKAADALLAFKGAPAQPLPGNKRPAGPVSTPQPGGEESREDRRKRLADSLKR